MTKSSLPLDTGLSLIKSDTQFTGAHQLRNLPQSPPISLVEALSKTFQFIQLNYQCPFTPSDKSHVKDEADLRIEIVNQDRLAGRRGRQGRLAGRWGRQGRLAGRWGLAWLCWAGSWAGKGRQGQAGARLGPGLGTGQVGQIGQSGRLAGRRGRLAGRQEDR
ncbi:hypothetical protein BY996DRAFT_6533298 [Phakopsora pachyrhizi]|uniref:Uncharacterized protein n=1 Tax=Phakopsora pachyrhizi TaxID=170000 RepID=A0AAV0AUD9_PHAPC|nr:hypothetical protein BY996DRAFT_6533298 [Phakopsora pachyrhizi]CAH7673341.1 hypothetical protein PPACK8108_LOCUS8231 [Phakopsora pachyrhizi]